jgi:hypothetical protein
MQHGWNERTEANRHGEGSGPRDFNPSRVLCRFAQMASDDGGEDAVVVRER